MSRFSGGFTTQQAGNSRHDSRDTQLIDWLLGEDQPSVRYHTLVDLLERNEDDPEVKAAHSTIPRVGWAHDLLRTQKPKGYWEAHEPRTVREWVNFLRFPLYNSSIWKGIVLSDLGLTATDRGSEGSPTASSSTSCTSARR